MAASPLTIRKDVTVTGNMTFTAGNGSLGNDTDNLTITENATVTLDSAAPGTLTFNAGDDILFANISEPAIVTTGGGQHTVELNADTEGATGDDESHRGYERLRDLKVALCRESGRHGGISR